jgi:hypothetical protein
MITIFLDPTLHETCATKVLPWHFAIYDSRPGFYAYVRSEEREISVRLPVVPPLSKDLTHRHVLRGSDWSTYERQCPTVTCSIMSGPYRLGAPQPDNRHHVMLLVVPPNERGEPSLPAEHRGYNPVYMWGRKQRFPCLFVFSSRYL